MVHHFHGLVTGARGNSVGSREEMRALLGRVPDAFTMMAEFHVLYAIVVVLSFVWAGWALGRTGTGC